MSVTAAEVLFRNVGVARQTVRSLASPGSRLGSTAVSMEWKPTDEMLERRDARAAARFYHRGVDAASG